MQIPYKVRLIAKALGLLIISPVYVPAVIVYENRTDVYNFYKDVFKILTFTHPEFKDKD
jgi:hypothetical protein